MENQTMTEIMVVYERTGRKTEDIPPVVGQEKIFEEA